MRVTIINSEPSPVQALKMCIENIKELTSNINVYGENRTSAKISDIEATLKRMEKSEKESEMKLNSEEVLKYQTDFTFNCEDEIVAKAIDILQSRVEVGMQITSPDTIKQYLTMTEPAPDIEVFRVVWLDNRHRVLGVEELARGTINSATVYPREVVKAALKANAAAAVISHNHPSSNVTPSESDKALTDKLRKAFELLDIRLLDHIVTGKGKSFSMAEAGYI